LVQATILDIKAEFDVILGMSLYHQWKPIPDGDILDMLISTLKKIHINDNRNGNIKKAQIDYNAR